MARRVAVRGIIIREGKLLCVRLKPYKGRLRSAGGMYWCLPGGGLEDNEPLLAGIEREMLEETGIAPVVGDLLYVQQFSHHDTEYLEFFFHITNAADYMQIDLSKTTHGAKELAEIAFIDPAAVRVLPDFLATEPLTTIAGSHQPPKIISRF